MQWDDRAWEGGGPPGASRGWHFETWGGTQQALAVGARQHSANQQAPAQCSGSNRRAMRGVQRVTHGCMKGECDGQSKAAKGKGTAVRKGAVGLLTAAQQDGWRPVLNGSGRAPPVGSAVECRPPILYPPTLPSAPLSRPSTLDLVDNRCSSPGCSDVTGRTSVDFSPRFKHAHAVTIREDVGCGGMAAHTHDQPRTGGTVRCAVGAGLAAAGVRRLRKEMQ